MSKMNEAEKAFRELTSLDFIKDFKNEFNEEFIMYRIHGYNQKYITGSELDWEMGWRFDGTSILTQAFRLADDEYKLAIGKS